MTRRRLARSLMAVVGSGMLLLASTGAALAKFPYFSVTLDPAEPRPDQPITVTVRTWADPGHTEPAGFHYEGSDFGLLEFRRAGEGEGPATIPVFLETVDTDVLRGEVVLPAGEWRLESYPHGRGAIGDFGPGYPEPITIVVAHEPGGAWLALSLGAGALGLLAFGAVRLRASHPRVARPSPSAP